MPTLDDEPSMISLPMTFKLSKRAVSITKLQASPHRDAAIRQRLLGLEDTTDRFKLNPMALYENLENGKIPTNDQILQALQSLEKMISQTCMDQSATAKSEEIMNQFARVLESCHDFIRLKNEQSDIQRSLHHLRLASKSFPTTETGSRLKKLINDHAFLDKGKDLLLLLIISPDFRDLLLELGQVIAKMFAKVADTSKIDENALKDKGTSQSVEANIDPQRKKLVAQFLDVMDDMVKEKDSFEALDFIIKSMRSSEREIKEIVGAGTDSKDSVIDANLERAKEDFMVILQKVSGHPLDVYKNEIKEITNKLKQDYKLRNIIDELLTFLERSLRDDNFRKDKDTILAGCLMIENRLPYIDASCGKNIENLSKELNQFLKDIQNDSQVQNLSSSIKSLIDSFYIQMGDKMVLNQETLNDLMLTLLPTLLNQIRTITIPKIKNINKRFNLELDPIDLCLDDILPSFIESKLSKGMIMGIRDTITDQSYISISLVLHELQINLVHVPFSFKLRSGMIHFQDQGNLDFQTLKGGISLKIKVNYYPKDSKKTLKVERVDVFMDKIKIKIHGKSHETLYYILYPAIKSLIRSHFSKSIRLKILEIATKVDAIFTSRKVQYLSKSMDKRKSIKGQSRTSREKMHSKQGREVYPWESNVFDLTYI